MNLQEYLISIFDYRVCISDRYLNGSLIALTLYTKTAADFVKYLSKQISIVVTGTQIVLRKRNNYFFGKFYVKEKKEVGWSSGNVIFSGMRGLRLKSWAGQIKHRVANGSPPLQYFFERSCVCCPGAMTRRWAPQTRTLPWRTTASVMMKDFI